MGERVVNPRRRIRNAVATRAAILAAARAHFAADSYERVGVREIAATAGVDPALVIRYFGSKEGLLRAALHQGGDLIPILAEDRATAGERLARLVLLKDEVKDGSDWLLVLLRSAANEEAGNALRDAVEGQFIRPLADWLGGEQAHLRASLIVAYVLGLMIGRKVLRTEALATGSIEELVALIAPVLQACIDGKIVGAARVAGRSRLRPGTAMRRRGRRRLTVCWLRRSPRLIGPSNGRRRRGQPELPTLRAGRDVSSQSTSQRASELVSWPVQSSCSAAAMTETSRMSPAETRRQSSSARAKSNRSGKR